MEAPVPLDACSVIEDSWHLTKQAGTLAQNFGLEMSLKHKFEIEMRERTPKLRTIYNGRQYCSIGKQSKHKNTNTKPELAS